MKQEPGLTCYEGYPIEDIIIIILIILFESKFLGENQVRLVKFQ